MCLADVPLCLSFLPFPCGFGCVGGGGGGAAGVLASWVVAVLFFPLRFLYKFSSCVSYAKGSFFGLVGLRRLRGGVSWGVLARAGGARANISYILGLGAFLRVGGSHGVCSATGGPRPL